MNISDVLELLQQDGKIVSERNRPLVLLTSDNKHYVISSEIFLTLRQKHLIILSNMTETKTEYRIVR